MQGAASTASRGGGGAPPDEEFDDVRITGIVLAPAVFDRMLSVLRRRGGKRNLLEVKSEEDGQSAGSLDSQQVQVVSALSSGSWRFDPARNPRAVSQWGHLLRDVSVTELRQTHGTVSLHFLHGPHRGQPVEGLTESLIAGEASVRDVSPLVVVLQDSTLWTIFGNRRLKALKSYQAAVQREVFARCIVHDFDARDAKVPPELVAKLIDNSSTANGGLFAPFGSRRRFGGHDRGLRLGPGPCAGFGAAR